ncbi:MAG: M20 family metallopeptidase [Chloroflexi bacterium]|nr:M20 family metallopeptidase [Chloroflexota bacterium]
MSINTVLERITTARLTELARTIVAIPSVTNSEGAMSNFTADFLAQHGYRITRLPVADSGDTIVAEIGQGERSFMLNYHLDTFDVFAGWHTDPFTPTMIGNRMYGLGTHDMKGGAACVLAIAEQIAPFANQLHGRLLITATSDEENWSRGAHAIINGGFLKGCIGNLVPEPANAGTLTVGQRGRHVFHIRFFGKTVHAAFGGGVNAAADAARVVAALEEPGVVDLGWNNEFQLAGTLNVIGVHSGGTMILVPEVADVWIDRHILPGETMDHAMQQIRAVIERTCRHSTWALTVDERPTPAPGPYVVPKNHPLVKTMHAALAQEYNMQIMHVLGRSVADTSHFAFHGHVPTLICGPQGGNTCETNEWLDVDSLLPTARAMARATWQMLAGNSNA